MAARAADRPDIRQRRGHPDQRDARRRVEVSSYLDASVVVALLTDDALHVRADRFARTDPGPLMVSDLAAAEFASALGRQVRMGALAVEAARAGLSVLDVWMRRAANQIETTAAD